MEAYRELSKEIGHRTKLQNLEHYEAGGKETSLVGKMRTGPLHSHGHRKDQQHHTSSSNNNHHHHLKSRLVSGYTEYLGKTWGRSSASTHTRSIFNYTDAKRLRESAANGTYEEGMCHPL